MPMRTSTSHAGERVSTRASVRDQVIYKAAGRRAPNPVRSAHRQCDPAEALGELSGITCSRLACVGWGWD